MRVLWFSNTPANSTEFLESQVTYGGWLASLDKEMQKQEEIELAISFFYPKKLKPFKYLNTRYFPLYNQFIKSTGFYKHLSKFKANAFQNVDNTSYINVIEEFKPDIIHIHGTENPFGGIVQITNVPVVFSIQSIVSVYELKYYSGFPGSSLIKFRTPMNILRWLNIEFVRKQRFVEMGKQERIVLKSAKSIIGRTEWDKRVLSVLAPEANYFHNDEILRLEFSNYHWKYKKNEKIIIHSTLGTAIYKGLETIYFAAEILKDRIEFIWNIAGIRSNNSIVKTVENYTKLKHCRLCINFIGTHNTQSIINRMMDANVFVHPSHIENSSNSICEAMMLGMPIIATNTGGTNSILENNKEGVLIQDGDYFALAGAILELINSPQKALSFGNSARIRAINRHNGVKICCDLVNIYKTIVTEDNYIDRKV